jgi:hypothetical protein
LPVESPEELRSPVLTDESLLDEAIAASTPPSHVRRSQRGKWKRFFQSWQFWIILTLLLVTGTGGLAIALLLKLPALPNCPSIFWPTASGSLRLYCAQLAAKKQTVKDLLEAIALVNSLPADHPLRPEINRQIEEWSADILNLAEQTFTGQCEVLKEDSSWSKPMDLKKAPYSAHNVRNRSKLVN